MKKTKKIFALLLALVMTLTMSASVFAATITINNPASNETYTAYKLFDVSNNGEAYSYSTTKEALVNALSDEDANLGIEFTKAASEDVWYVGGLESSDTTAAAALAQYIHNNWTNTFASLLGTGTNASVDDETDETTITVTDPGYYFVTSSLGSLCALDTATAEVTINEKNSIPSITKAVQEDSTGLYGEDATIDVIDTVYYQLTVNTGTNDQGNGTGVDGNYVITDVLPAGIVYNDGTVYIADWTLGTDYTVSFDDDSNTLTITLLSTGALADLSQNSNIVITYNARVTENLTVEMAHTNKVTLTYKHQESKDEAAVYTYGIGGTAEGSTITKIDGTTDQPLANVKFILSKTEIVEGTSTTYYAQFNDSNYLTDWVTDQDDASDLVTDAKGHIYAYGLDAGTYTLTETETLEGYNLLNDTITATIAEDGTVVYKLTNSSSDAENTITIENMTGEELPSTGGMGTTVIYILGAALVLGAGIVLVVRRRMSSDR